jgi:hypothetical protein
MKNYFFSIGLIFLLIFTSCVTKRSIIKAPIKEKGETYLFDKLKENELKYTSFSAKFSAEYEKNNKRTKISGTIRISRDSLIWATITPILGIEAARISISLDSVKVINKIDGNYLIKDFSFINNMLNRNLDYDMLQSLITGNDFSVYDNNSFKAGMDNKEYKLSTYNRKKLRQLSKLDDSIRSTIPLEQINLNPETFKISKVIIKEGENTIRTFVATYSNHTLIDKQLVPQTVIFSINDGVNKIKITLKYSKILINPTQNYPFNINSKYNRVDNFQTTN